MRYFSHFFAVLALIVLAGYYPQSALAQTNAFPSFYEDFESGENGWSTSGDLSTWALGYPSSAEVQNPANGSNCWKTNLSGPYNSDEYSYLESPVFDMSCFTSDPYLGFNHIYFTEDNYDFHWVEISIDGGTWQKLGSAWEATSWYQSWEDGNSGDIVDAWCGYYAFCSGWEYAEHVLTGAAGSNNVRIRFVMKADGSIQEDGVAVDDIQIFLPGVELATPTLATPNNSSTGVTLTPNLSWQAVGCADDYTVQVATDAAFTSVVFNEVVAGTTTGIGTLSYLTTYYWRVQANRNPMISQWSTVYDFTTVAPPPAIPTLATPTNAEKAVTIQNSTLVWNVSTGATTYRVQFSNDNLFSSTIIDNTTGANFASLPQLTNFTTYYWRVNATNSSGTSEWSDVWSFRTVLSSSTLVSPSNGETYITNPATVVWQNVNGADHYWIQIATDQDFTTIVNENTNSTLLSYQVPSLNSNTRYYWRVKAVTPDGETSNWSEVRSFTTIIATPLLSLPLDGKLDLPTSVPFEWNSVNGDVQYNIQVSVDVSFISSIIIDRTYPTINQTITGFANNTVYYWRVRAVSSSSGNSGWSTIRSFSTVVAPTVGELPVDKVKGLHLPVTLQWTSSGKKVLYQAQISTDETFKTIVSDVSRIESISSQFSQYEGLKNNTTYYWRVRPESSTGINISWSPTRSFTTVVAKTALTSPANNSGSQLLSVQLKWNPVEGASTYKVQFSTDKTFTTTIVNEDNISATQFSVANLAVNTIYYWRVQANSIDNGTGVWSDTWKFSTGLAPAGIPILDSPSNNKVNQPIVFDFKWNPADNALTYHLQVSKTQDFENIVLNEDAIASSSFAASGLELGSTYYWRLRSANALGLSEWSESWKFTVIPAAPASPSLVTPADKAVKQQPVSLTLQWAKSALGGEVESYHVQVSTAEDFSTTVLDEAAVTTNSYTLSNLNGKTLYYWRVSAKNAGGNSEWTSVWSFTTDEKTGVSSSDNELGVVLNAVSPNPVQASALVQFTNPITIHKATLKIYSISGIEVFSMVENELQSGNHAYNWNTSDVPSGVYIVKLTADNTVQSVTVNVAK